MILLSGFFSASETAFSSVNLIRLRQYAEEGKRGAKRALSVAERFDEVLLAILIGNNIVNLASASLATIVATEVLSLGASGVPIATAVMTVLIIIFGEILPKSYAKENAESLTLVIGNIYYYLTLILKPLIKVFMVLKELVAKLYRKKEVEPSVTEDELNVIIDTMEEEGVLEQEEVEMIQSVLDLSETRVKEIMTPRVDMVSINLQASLDEVKEVFLSEKYSRIPVYDESNDDIVGILYQHDVFVHLIENENQPLVISDVMKNPIFIPCGMKVSDLLSRLQQEKQHMAIVSDEYGGTAGLVTMEDALEEVVGEIYDEHDEEEQLLIRLSEAQFEVSAEMPIDELFDEIHVSLKAPEDYRSIGSWLYAEIKDVPEVGMTHDYQFLNFVISEVEDRRIKSIRLTILPNEEEAKEQSEDSTSLNEVLLA